MKIKRLFIILVLAVLSWGGFADDITDFYNEWKTLAATDVQAANKKLAMQIEEYEKTREFAVYKVQQPDMANTILRMKADVLVGGGYELK